MKNNYLVLDQGGHATRALIFSQSGEILFHCESPISLIEMPGFKVEHSTVEMLNSFNEVLSKSQHFIQKNNIQVASAGLATQRSSFVCINKHTGTALTPIISWQDRRAFDEIEKYRIYADKIYQHTGLILNSHYGASKMHWCLQNIDVVKIAYSRHELMFTPLACYVMHHILKEKPLMIDPGNASRTLLMNVYTSDWDEEMLMLFGLEKHVLPAIRTTKTEYGHIMMGQKEIPLTICTGDQNATLFSLGAPSPSHLYVNVGTGAFILNVGGNKKSDYNNKLLNSVIYSDDQKTLFALEGTVNGAGRALQWLAAESGMNDFETHIEDWMRIYKNPPVFINAIAGIGSPYWLPSLESSFEYETVIEEKFVSVIESILFLISRNIEIIQQLQHISGILISGGIANNDLFCQYLADLNNISVQRSEITEATARGVFNLLVSNKNQHYSQHKEKARIFYTSTNHGLQSRFLKWKNKMGQLKS